MKENHKTSERKPDSPQDPPGKKKKTEAASLIENNERQARYYHDEVNTAMEALRKPIDQLEMIVDKEMCQCHPTAT